MHRRLYALAVVAALAVTPAHAGWARFVLAPPTLYTDGQPIAPGDITGYRFEWGTSPTVLTSSVVLEPAPEFLVEGLPDTGTLYFAASAIPISGIPSARSNIACFNMSGGACVAGPFETNVTAVTFTEPTLSPLAFDGELWIHDPSGEGYRLTVTNRSPLRITQIRATLTPTSAVFDSANVPAGAVAATVAPTIGGNNNGVSANQITFTLSAPLAQGASFVRTGDIDGFTLTGASVRVTYEGGQTLTKQVPRT